MRKIKAEKYICFICGKIGKSINKRRTMCNKCKKGYTHKNQQTIFKHRNKILKTYL